MHRILIKNWNKENNSNWLVLLDQDYLLKDLVLKCLEFNPKEWIDSPSVLKHSYFN